MTYDELAGSVKLSEGFRDHVYIDTEGFRTIGWGHKVVHEDKFEDGKKYTKEELQDVFDKDLNKAIGQGNSWKNMVSLICLQPRNTPLPKWYINLENQACPSSVTCGNACRTEILKVQV